ncbi:MAG: hypothetical protein ACXVQ4_08050 [Gaiellaceae bacterium]
MHIGALKRGARAFVNGDPYTFEIERNMDVIPWEFALYATPIRNPKNNLGSIVGDAVNNLRAALDNLVWELGDLDRGPPPPDPIPRGNPWRRVSFPIVLDETPNGEHSARRASGPSGQVGCGVREAATVSSSKARTAPRRIRCSG